MPNQQQFAKIVLLLLDAEIENLTEEMKKIGISNSIIMSISVAKSALKNDIVTDESAKEFLKSVCQRIIELNGYRLDLLRYLEARMALVAPNVCEIIGPKVTSLLVSAAGGIQELSRIPACNILVLGAEKRALNGLSAATAGIHRGYLNELEMVKNAPLAFQTQLLRMLSTKCALAARIDACQTEKTGSYGIKLRKEIQERFDKIQAPGQARLTKALPKPDGKPKKKRGGQK